MGREGPDALLRNRLVCGVLHSTRSEKRDLSWSVFCYHQVTVWKILCVCAPALRWSGERRVFSTYRLTFDNDLSQTIGLTVNLFKGICRICYALQISSVFDTEGTHLETAGLQPSWMTKDLELCTPPSPILLFDRLEAERCWLDAYYHMQTKSRHVSWFHG